MQRGFPAIPLNEYSSRKKLTFRDCSGSHRQPYDPEGTMNIRKETAMNHNDDQETQTATPTGGEARLARHGGLSYLHVPAVDVHQSVAFYEQVFGWKIHGRDTDHPGFDDGTGHVSGAWVTDQAISREPGLLPYIYVDRIDDTIEQVEARGGKIVKAPYPEGNLWVATFRDPAGNVLGLWQEGAR
jgi:predicted enzyme related to lactoylglutathione lyase